MDQQQARVIAPQDLIGVTEAARIRGVSRPTITRQIESGKLAYVAKLDGKRGAYVLDRNDVKGAK